MRAKLPAITLAALALTGCLTELPALPPGTATGCAGDGDCLAGQTCASGTCVDKGCPASCPEGQECRAGACVDKGCPATCPSGQECRGGACQACAGGICGGCGACPSVAHAASRCVAGKCGRGPCEPGWFDLDGARTPGCEARCVGKHLTDGAGASLDVDACPPPEAGAVAQTMAAAGALGATVQTSAQNTNYAILGEPTPPGPGGAVEQRSATHRNLAGFTAVLPR